MTGISNSIQQAIYSALSNDSALDALLARFYVVETQSYDSNRPAIYDDVPQESDTGDDSFFPYVTIGADTVNDWSTDTASGGMVQVSIDSWSRQAGRKEVKEIQEAIYNALHRAELTTPGFEFIGCEFEDENTIVDPDTETRHGVQNFRIYVDEIGYGE